MQKRVAKGLISFHFYELSRMSKSHLTEKELKLGGKEEKNGEWLLMDRGPLFGVIKMFCNKIVMIAIKYL